MRNVPETAAAPPSWLTKTLRSFPRRPKAPPLNTSIDLPLDGDLVYQHGFDCQGWAHHDDSPIRKIEVIVDEIVLGSTEVLYARPDVARFFQRDDMTQVGFTVRCIVPEALRARDGLELRFEMILDDGATRSTFARRVVRFSKVDYRRHGHGGILTDAASDFLKRDQVYGSGPPSPVAGPLCVEIVKRYLPKEATVLDVGCGIGAWCDPLTSHGLQWTGCETRVDFVQHMLAAGLRAVNVQDGKLPFADGAFDWTISIEVLEHVSEHESFLAEVARVSKQGGLFSVPNFAAIPVTSSVYALPWHMLESDHKNFFTVRSLSELLKRYYASVETFEYGPLPDFRSTEGLEIMNHVFAIARR